MTTRDQNKTPIGLKTVVDNMGDFAFINFMLLCDIGLLPAWVQSPPGLDPR